MPTPADSGTTAALVIGTQIVLKTGYGTFSLGNATGQYTTNKNFVLAVDTINMVAGDVIELRIYTATLVAANEQLAYYATYAHAQAHPIKYSVPVPANISIKATIVQTAGTGRTFTWSLLAVA